MKTAAQQQRGSGGLTTLITVQKIKDDATVDNYNEIDQSASASWETRFQCRAAVREARGNERFNDDRNIATSDLVFDLLASVTTAAISTRDRITYTDRWGRGHTVHVVDVTVGDRWVRVSGLEDVS